MITLFPDASLVCKAGSSFVESIRYNIEMGHFISVCFLVLMGSVAQAGFLVEPYLGYESGTLTQTDTANIDLSGKTTMVDAGLRVGYIFGRGIWLAVDYMTGFNGKFTYDDVTNGTTMKTNKTDLGVTLGFDYQRKFRMYLGYFVEPVFRTVDEAIGGQENTYLNGSSYKVGIGYIFGTWFAWSVEYYKNAPAKYRNDTGTYSVSDVNNSLAETGVRVIASIPFELTR